MTCGSRGWFFLWKCWSNMIWTLKSMPPPPQFTIHNGLFWNFKMVQFLHTLSFILYLVLSWLLLWKIKCEKNHRNVLCALFQKITQFNIPYLLGQVLKHERLQKTFQWEIFSSISLIPKSHLVIIWKVKVPTERYKDPLQQPKRYASWSKSSSSSLTHR